MLDLGLPGRQCDQAPGRQPEGFERRACLRDGKVPSTPRKLRRITSKQKLVTAGEWSGQGVTDELSSLLCLR